MIELTAAARAGSVCNVVKIIESHEDGFTFERAFIASQGDCLVPRAVMGGVLCNIDTKPAPLADGLAWCEPLDGRDADAWPLCVIVEKQTAEGSPYRETLWNMTAHPSVVAAARRFAKLMSRGSAVDGAGLCSD